MPNLTTGDNRVLVVNRVTLAFSWILVGISGLVLADAVFSHTPIIGELLVRSNADRVFWLTSLLALLALGAYGVFCFSYSVWLGPRGAIFLVGVWPFRRKYRSTDVSEWDLSGHGMRRMLLISLRDGRNLRLLDFGSGDVDRIAAQLRVQ